MRSPVPAATPVLARDRLRLVLLLMMVLVWIGPQWAEAQVGYLIVSQGGAVRIGWLGAGTLLALWGLAATSLAARTVAGLRAGLHATEAALAGALAGLMGAAHPWMPTGLAREAWAPAFGCLALLALLDAVLCLRRPAHGGQVAIARAVAALVAAGALWVARAPVAAGFAAWLALMPLLALGARGPHAPRALRTGLETAVLLTAVGAGLAPILQEQLVGVAPAVSGRNFGWPGYAWCVLAAVVATTGLDGILRPVAYEDEAFGEGDATPADA